MDSFFDYKGDTWYCLSIYYSEKYYYKLMPAISSFCSIYSPDHHILFLSHHLGEHINLALAFSDRQNKIKLKEEIETFFKEILETSPSPPIKQTEYGKVLWKNYSCNTITWNRFELPIFINSKNILKFGDLTSLLIAYLIDDELDAPIDYFALILVLFLNFSKSNVFGRNNNFHEIVSGLYSKEESKDDDSLIVDNLSVLDSYYDYFENNDLLYKRWLNSVDKILLDHGSVNGICLLLDTIIYQIGMTFSYDQIFTIVSEWLKIKEKSNDRRFISNE
nr:hypothetical protein [uncultured Draconibacterium sp.]